MKYKIRSKTNDPEYIDKISMYKIGLVVEDEEGKLDGGSVYSRDKSFFNQLTIGGEIIAELKENKVGKTVNISLIVKKDSQDISDNTYLCDEDDEEF